MEENGKVKVYCPSCNQKLRVDAGTTEVTCPSCSGQFAIEAESPPKPEIIPTVKPAIPIPETRKPSSDEKACPKCGEFVKKEATFCRHCKNNILEVKKISCKCPVCAESFNTEETNTGKEIPCPICDQKITVNGNTTKPKVIPMPNSKQLNSDEKLCPECNEVIKKAANLCRFCKSNVPVGTSISYARKDHQMNHKITKDELDKLFWWWWFSAALGIPTLGIGFIASAVFFYILIYKYWCLIPPENAKITPGKAVGFMFIPFFNLYWGFIACWGLGKIFNQETGNAKNAEMWSLIYAICCCASVVCNFIDPILSSLAFVATVVSLFVMTINFQKSAKEII